MRRPTVLVIGGGAAGLSAAIAAARLGAQVTLLEAGARVGRKILASGNGRCNLSNTSVSPEAYNRPEFVGPVLAGYSWEGIREFFARMGLLTYSDEEGRIYPATNAAGSVLDVMRLECSHLGVDERCRFEVASLAQAPGLGGFEVSSLDGERLGADAVVVTTGGGSSLLAEFGHATVACAPVLGPIKTDPAPIRGLSGVRVKCAASILDVDGKVLATESGELLFRDYGVSGIMTFDLSRFLEQGRTLSIDFFPGVDAIELGAMLRERCAALRWRTADTFFDGMLQPRVAHAVLRAAGIGPATPVGELHCERLVPLLKDFRLPVMGIGDTKQAQVTRGGASTADVDAATLESRLVGGLFVAGEVLDVDGRCGGYNLHWAWASGIAAGESAARCAEARATGGVTTGGSE